MEDFQTRLRMFISHKGLTYKSFEQLCSFGNGTAKRFNENSKPRTFESISSVFPELNIDWLLTGEGEMIKPAIPKKVYLYDEISELSEEEQRRIREAVAGGKARVEGVIPEKNFISGVPYYDVDFECGFDELFPVDNANRECLISMPGFEKATLWCNATGRSMEPEISNGDIIALQKIEDISFLPYGNIYAIITANGLRTIKRLGRSSMPGHYLLVPANPDYDAQDIPIEMISHVYRVLGSMKAF